MKKKLFLQLLAIFTVIFIFAGFNIGVYKFFTSRLSNNFGSASQVKMIDVGRYLPFNEESDLYRYDTSLELEGELPVLDGAAALLPVYASVVENLYPEDSVSYIGGSFSDDNYYGENFAPESKLQYRNTVRGYEAIVDGTADILFCAAPTTEQKDYAKEKGVELIYTPIGKEAFAFFVNKNNPVNALDSEDIKGIYTGKYKNWSELGGADRAINPVTRYPGSGSESAMRAFMGELEYGAKSPLAFFGASIGYSFRFYMEGIVKNDNVKMLSLDGIYPDAESIRMGKYPLVTEFYAVCRSDNDNPNVQILIDWLLLPEGQELIEGTGYIGIG